MNTYFIIKGFQRHSDFLKFLPKKIKMNRFISKLLPVVTLVTIFSCSKNSPDTPRAVIPERLEIKSTSNSIKVGETATFSVKYFNTLGEEAPVPDGIVWSSSQVNVASISNAGVATAKAGGQTEIVAKRNSVEAKSLLSVVSNENEIATITIEPGIKELTLNDTSTLMAVARNINNQVIPGKTFTWQGSNNAAVQLSASGAVKGLAWGTSDIRASADGKVSSPVMVQVIRLGNFDGSGSKGTCKLKFENNILKLQTSSDFSVATGPPDLRIYLGNNSGNVSGAVEIGTLNIRTGLQTWNIPANVTIGQYKYAIVWCKRLGGLYGVADLGN